MFRLDGFAQVTQPLVCLNIPSFNFFFMTVFKSEVINQSVLTGLKILIIDFLGNIRNAVSILAAYRLVIFYIYAAWIQI